MPKRIAVTNLNGSTINILNVIRKNASLAYQSKIPEIEKETQIPQVGAVIYGEPAIANEFISSLINRIALVRAKSSIFNNPYAYLKKGYLEFGETMEEIFVDIAKVHAYSPENALKKEAKRSLPDIDTAFHIINWRVYYPVTIQDNDLKQAFLSLDGVESLIAKIVDSVYQAAEYDEFLLFKYMIIKAATKGLITLKNIPTGSSTTEYAVQFRAISNLFRFRTNKFTEFGNTNNAPIERQIIFMDAEFNARFDVDVLAGAFNLDRADFVGRLFLIDSFSTFDNARWDELRLETTGIEEVTEEELSLMEGVKSFMFDSDWFQVYDNLAKFTEKYFGSTLYWNYWYHIWKTVSHSPFANAIMFTEGGVVEPPTSFTAEIVTKEESKEATTFALNASSESATFTPYNVQFIQTEALTEAGIAVEKYGKIIIPADQFSTNITLQALIDENTYTATTTINASSAVGLDIELSSTPPSEP